MLLLEGIWGESLLEPSPACECFLWPWGTFWNAEDLEPILVGNGGGELSVDGGWSIKSYHLSSLECPLVEEVIVPSVLFTGNRPPHSIKDLLLDPVP